MVLRAILCSLFDINLNFVLFFSGSDEDYFDYVKSKFLFVILCFAASFNVLRYIIILQNESLKTELMLLEKQLIKEKIELISLLKENPSQIDVEQLKKIFEENDTLDT